MRRMSEEPTPDGVPDRLVRATIKLLAEQGPSAIKARAVAEESFVWYPKIAGHNIAELAEWMEERGQDLGNYAYAGEARKGEQHGFFDHLTMDYIYDSGAGVVGDPDRCIEICKRYEAVGCELLFCLLNPYKIPHESVMHSIELLGKHVIPEFA